MFSTSSKAPRVDHQNGRRSGPRTPLMTNPIHSPSLPLGQLSAQSFYGVQQLAVLRPRWQWNLVNSVLRVDSFTLLIVSQYQSNPAVLKVV